MSRRSSADAFQCVSRSISNKPRFRRVKCAFHSDMGELRTNSIETRSEFAIRVLCLWQWHTYWRKMKFKLTPKETIQLFNCFDWILFFKMSVKGKCWSVSFFISSNNCWLFSFSIMPMKTFCSFKWEQSSMLKMISSLSSFCLMKKAMKQMKIDFR